MSKDLLCLLLCHISVLFRNGEVEEVALSDALVNPSHEKVGPQHFNLLKVLGKGGYGKVSYFTYIYTENSSHFCIPSFEGACLNCEQSTQNNEHCFLKEWPDPREARSVGTSQPVVKDKQLRQMAPNLR